MALIKYTHQYDLNGCGIACLANLLEQSYEEVKADFENSFYKIDRGIKVFDLVLYLKYRGRLYQSEFFNPKNIDIDKAIKTASTIGSITLIHKSSIYPVGHYLLRTAEGWVDSWINFPSINNVHSGIRDILPGNPWYILIPKTI